MCVCVWVCGDGGARVSNWGWMKRLEAFVVVARLLYAGEPAISGGSEEVEEEGGGRKGFSGRCVKMR